MLQYLTLVGVALQLVGIASYIRGTLTGITKPNRVTWLLWAVAPMIGTAAALAKGVTWAVLPSFMAGFGPFLVLLVSFFNPQSYWKLSKLDYACGAASVLALVLWAITDEPLVAIAFAILSDGLAALPTLVKIYRHPETEVVTPYLLGIIAQCTSFAAIRYWVFVEYAMPAYFILINILLVAGYYLGKRKLELTAHRSAP